MPQKNISEKSNDLVRDVIVADKAPSTKPIAVGDAQAPATLYCSYIHLPGDEYCFTMAEWATPWTAASALIALAVALVGGYSVIKQLAHMRKTSDEEAALRRTEFFLAQHRRLFDDKDLSEVIGYLDGDDVELKEKNMWEKNRKFMAFIEEIALLIRSNKIDKNVAYYMFGYYALQARNGDNFNTGISTAPEYWWWFNKFCDDYEEFSNKAMVDSIPYLVL